MLEQAQSDPQEETQRLAVENVVPANDQKPVLPMTKTLNYDLTGTELAKFEVNVHLAEIKLISIIAPQPKQPVDAHEAMIVDDGLIVPIKEKSVEEVRRVQAVQIRSEFTSLMNLRRTQNRGALDIGSIPAVYGPIRDMMSSVLCALNEQQMGRLCLEVVYTLSGEGQLSNEIFTKTLCQAWTAAVNTLEKEERYKEARSVMQDNNSRAMHRLSEVAKAMFEEHAPRRSVTDFTSGFADRLKEKLSALRPA